MTTPLPLQVHVKNIDSYIEIPGGATLNDLMSILPEPLPFTPICAQVNNKTQSLSFQIFAPKEIEFLSADTPSGRRVYARSLCMMLYRATCQLFPHNRLNICHSLTNGYFFRISGVDSTPANASLLLELMNALVQRDLPFILHEQPTSEAVAIFRSQNLPDKVRLLETIHQPYTVYYTLDGIADSYYGALAPSTSHIRRFDIIPYHDGFILSLPAKISTDSITPRRPQEKLFNAFVDYAKFNDVVGVRNVGQLNKTTEAGRSADLINVAEALHDKKIAEIADDITDRYHRGGARIVLIAGPSSSGKTTFAKRLSIFLMTNLLRPHTISLDDYFVDRHLTPRDSSGDYDYESLYALDLDRFNSDLNSLLNGEEVELPAYNFTTGTTGPSGRRLQLNEGDILVIEGIHGLNPALTSHVAEQMKYRIYVSALTTLALDNHNWVPTTDNRLLRRIIRDHKYRGTSPLDTIRRWPSVRRGEERWIFPFQENADKMFNSSLLFELAVMRPYAEEILRYFPRDTPEYAEAYRLRRFLSYFTPIAAKDIPPTSLLREFLGGSSFHY